MNGAIITFGGKSSIVLNRKNFQNKNGVFIPLGLIAGHLQRSGRVLVDIFVSRGMVSNLDIIIST